jgi:hypothetical protein
MTDLPTEVAALRAGRRSGDRVLSAYLDVSPPAVLGRGYLMAFRGARRQLRATLPATEHTAFDRAAARIDRYLVEVFVPQGPGLAVFAAPAGTWFHALALPLPPRHDLAWGETALLAPLEEMLADQARVAVALFDKERARLFTVFLGRIEARRELVDELAPKHRSGGWHLLSQTRFQRHHEETVVRHARHAARALVELHRQLPFDHLLLAGPPEAVAVLRGHLPAPMRVRLAGRLDLALTADDEQVRRAVLAKCAALARADEERAVLELFESATTPAAALGLRPTLVALNEGRVRRLLVSDAFAARGGECRRCAALIAGVGSCPTCGGPSRPLASLREEVVARTLEQGAAVDTVAGPAADLLSLYDGLAAWTRPGTASPALGVVA